MIDSFQSKDGYENMQSYKSRFKIFLCKLFGLLIQISLSNSLRVRFGKAMGVKIGKNVFIGKYCILDDTFPQLISIADNVNISFAVTIVAHDASKEEVGRVSINQGAYIGTRSVILPGVTIGEEAVIGAGSVVTQNVPTRAVVAGVPARALKNSGIKIAV